MIKKTILLLRRFNAFYPFAKMDEFVFYWVEFSGLEL